MKNRGVKRIVNAFFVILLLVLPQIGAADAKTQQRNDYLAAMKALAAGDFARFADLLEKLQDYPLRPFLEYAFLKTHLEEASSPTLHTFIERNRQVFVSERLRRHWLRDLSARKDWKTFLRAYHPNVKDPDIQCSRLHAEISENGYRPELDESLELLWLVGTSQAQQCDPVFIIWRKAGKITDERVWRRIELAMKQGDLELAGYLAREYLNPEEQLWVQRWQNMHSQPQQELSKLSYPPNTPRARAIWQHGIDRLSRTDVEQTIDAWLKLAQRDELTESDHNYARRQIGLHAAWQHNPVAAQWLDQLPPEASDPLVRQWRLLSTLRSQDWVAAERAIATLSPEELDENKWLYWKARILSKNGDPEAAREIFQELAKSRHYYGFLAADQIDYPYYMGHTALNASADDVHRLENRLSMITARELYHIGEMDTARSQWDWATRNLNEIELRAAAAIAYRWQWHDRAIITVTRAGHRDDLELRFPLLYQELIQTNANVRNLDVASIFGVIRQESAFVVDARSGAGALGLMQLMPQTARLEGRKHELELSSDRELFDPRKNITLGTGYLRTLLDRFGGNLVLATASYNAGPNRVQQWLPQGGTIDADVWVETIPFSETRNFVKNVLAFSAVYDYRLGKKPKRLRERMPPIHSAG